MYILRNTSAHAKDLSSSVVSSYRKRLLIGRIIQTGSILTEIVAMSLFSSYVTNVIVNIVASDRNQPRNATH